MLLLKLIEVDQPTSCVLYLLTRLGDKKPKVPTGCLDLIREAISSFGIKSFPVKVFVLQHESRFAPEGFVYDGCKPSIRMATHKAHRSFISEG